MPLIQHGLADYFHLMKHCDYIINPVNCIGVMGAGLALEFKERFPDMFKEYQEKCDKKWLTVANPIYEYKDDKSGVIILNLVTKRHWRDNSSIDDIKHVLYKLREYIQSKPSESVFGMTMIGTGLGRLKTADVWVLMSDILDDLPNPIIVSIWPKNAPYPLRYLSITGSRVLSQIYFNLKEEISYEKHIHLYQKAILDTFLPDALCQWNVTEKENYFVSVISGGARGTDTASEKVGHDLLSIGICRKEPIIFPANWKKHGLIAGYKRNNQLIEIGTHFIVLLTKDQASKGTKHFLAGLKSYNNRSENEIKKNVALFLI